MLLDIIVSLLTAIGAVTVLLTFGVLLWVAMAGDREDRWPDEEPTLQVQNRIGDSRPIADRINRMAGGYFG